MGSQLAKPALLVVGLGEVLWDVFPDGRRPGGAPANVAFHVGQLGCRGMIASRVGTDEPGDALLAFLQGQRLDTSLIQRDPVHPTGRVTVAIERGDHPTYTIHEGVAWDYLEASPDLIDAMSGAAAVCFGTLAQRAPVSREAIAQLLEACPSETLIVFDVNLRQNWFDRETVDRSLQRADVLKLNGDEVPIVAGLLETVHISPEDFSRFVQDRYDVSLVCVTRGAEGCLLTRGTEQINQPGQRVQVVDTVGAGDSFTAALIAAQLQGRSLAESAALANRVGAYVAQQPGAMPTLAADLIAAFAM